MSKRRERRAKRQLHFLNERFYDDTVSRKDQQGLNRPAQMVGQREMESAYVRGSEYQQARIEEFKPLFPVFEPAIMPEESLHNFA